MSEAAQTSVAPPSPKPVATKQAVYVAIIPLLVERARKLGYALAVHGSLARDLDVVAVPWVEEAVSAEELLLDLLAAVGWNGCRLTPETTNQDGTLHAKSGAVPTSKPHGRRAWSLHFDNGLYVDISVMPRNQDQSRAMPTAPGAEAK